MSASAPLLSTIPPTAEPLTAATMGYGSLRLLSSLRYPWRQMGRRQAGQTLTGISVARWLTPGTQAGSFPTKVRISGTCASLNLAVPHEMGVIRHVFEFMSS